MDNNNAIQQLQQAITQHTGFLADIKQQMSLHLIGQQYVQDRLLIALITQGHILLQGLPGLAKTLAIKTLSTTLGGHFSRIQFTPDLLPADVVGTMIYNQQKAQFEVKKGPIFANFILADEINRAPAKVQSALLEAMQEKQITIGDTTYKLPAPFLVMATQNPIEQEGTYQLPEAQVDRFMLKVNVGYPSKTEEQQILRQYTQPAIAPVKQVASSEQLLQVQGLVQQVYLDPKIEQYIIDLVFATRNPAEYKLAKLSNMIQYGASPRASIALCLAAKAYALLQQRAYVIPEDVRAIAMDVLQHRVGITYEAEANNVNSQQIVTEILNTVAVP
jgi:MoxR-like ATPase